MSTFDALSRLLGVIESTLKLPPHKVDVDADLESLGINSLIMMELIGNIEKEYDIALTPALLVDVATVAELDALLENLKPDRAVAAGADAAIASPKLLLSHNPNIFDEAAGHGIPLTLSGHTHAGQIILPFPENHGYSFARLIYKRDYGLYRNGDSMLYINRGLGVIGAPLRINCPREITKIVLKRS